MADSAHFELISLSGLKINLKPERNSEIECTVDINAGVFRGNFVTVYFDDDLREFDSMLQVFTAPGVLRLGGGRAAEITFVLRNQAGGKPGSLAVEVSATPSGDDPWPRLTFLEFDVPADFAQTTSAKIERFFVEHRKS